MKNSDRTLLAFGRNVARIRADRGFQVPELQAARGMVPKIKLESGTRRDRIKMIGNSVCPPVMRYVVTTLTSGQACSIPRNARRL